MRSREMVLLALVAILWAIAKGHVNVSSSTTEVRNGGKNLAVETIDLVLDRKQKPGKKHEKRCWIRRSDGRRCCKRRGKPLKCSKPIWVVLPSNVKINISSTNHCCKKRNVKGYKNMYILSGKFNQDDHKDFGCSNDCIYSKTGISKLYCFKSKKSKCVEHSEDYINFSENAKQTGKLLNDFFNNKTIEYGNLNTFTTLKDKLEWVKKDLENITGKNFTSLQQKNDYNKIIQSLSPKRREKFKAFKVTVDKHMEKINKLYQKHGHHDDLDKELDVMKEDLLHQSHDDHELHNITHHFIESTKVISHIVKPETHGGSDRLNTFFKALVSNTEQSNMTFNHLRESRGSCNCGCDMTIAVSSGLVLGCSAGAAFGIATAGTLLLPALGWGCAAGAIDGLIVGGITCGVKAIFHAACFATTSKVETISGIKNISELVIGDSVQTYAGGMSPHYTEFIGWLDRQKFSPVKMLKVSTSQEISPLILSGSHIVFTSNTTKYADELRSGDCLVYWNGTHIVEQTVTEIENAIEFGWWAPLTRAGTLLVDGYLASCYASFPHKLADVAMIPVKALPTVLLDNEESQHEDGVRSVVKKIKKIGEAIGARKIKSKIDKDLFSPNDKVFPLQAFANKLEL